MIAEHHCPDPGPATWDLLSRGQRISGLAPELFEPQLLTIIGRVAATGISEQYTTFHSPTQSLGEVRNNTVFFIDSGEIGIVSDDITLGSRQTKALERADLIYSLQKRIMGLLWDPESDPATLLIMESLTMALQSRFGLIGYLDQRGQLITKNITHTPQPCTHTGGDKPYCPNDNPSDIVEAVLRSGSGPIIENSPLSLPLAKIGLQNCLAVPLMRLNGTFGLLLLGDKEGPYSNEDATLLTQIAVTLAPVLVNWCQTREQQGLLEETRRQLWQSATTLTEIQRLTSTGYRHHDHQEDRSFWSEELYHIFGLDTVTGSAPLPRIMDQIHPDDKKRVGHCYRQAKTSKEGVDINYRIYQDDGTLRYLHEQSVTISGPHTKAPYSLNLIQDISRKVALDQERTWMAMAMAQTKDAIIITGKSGTIQYVNPAFEQLSGYSAEDVIGHPPRILQSGQHPPAFYENLWQTLGHSQEWHGRLINKKKNGELFTEEARIIPVLGRKGQICNFMAIKHDITRELQLEERLQQALKMEAIGTLAGGIAHDFNNILGAILGYTRMAMENLSRDGQPYNDLAKVIQSGDRAVDLVRQILLFSRHQKQEFIPLRLEFLILEAMRMLRASLPSSIHFKEEIQRDCPTIMADPTQMHQIIMNLCSNAKQAMMATGGVLSIGLAIQDILEGQAIWEDRPVAAGQYLQLSVGDSGDGIAESHLKRIFEPFFTTKGVGQGTGLGLAVVHGIVSAHHGHISVSSKLHHGTTFQILLPSSPLQAPLSPPSHTGPDLPRGTGHILVVDDEPNILVIRRHLLQGLGYRVTTFSSSMKALEAFREDRDRFDLLLTDMTMPEMDGRKLTSKILELCPRLPVILCTGHSEHINESEAQELGFQSFLEKPVAPYTLAHALRRALQKGPMPPQL